MAIGKWGIGGGAYGAFDQEVGEGVSGLFEGGVVEADDDAGGVEIIVECLGFAKELGGEDNLGGDDLEASVCLTLAIAVLLTHTDGITDRDGALDDHHSIGVDTEDEVDDILDMMGVEEVLDGVVVGGGCDDNKVGILICCLAVEGCHEVQFLLPQVLLDILVLDGGDPVVDLLHFLGDDIYRCYLVVLCQEGCDRESHISCSCNCNFDHNLFKLKIENYFVFIFILTQISRIPRIILSPAEIAEIAESFLTKTAKTLSLISIFVKIMRLLPLMPDCKRVSIIHHQQHTQHSML